MLSFSLPTIGILAGIYAYILFALGLVGKLNKISIEFASVFVLGIFLFLGYKKRRPISLPKLSFVELFTIVILILTIAINLIGALGPEIFYDALWYHLTIPKIYLQKESVFFIPGNLLYYSAMPKLMELLYLGAMSISNEIGAKLIHFAFGLFSLFAVIKIANLYLDRKFSLLAGLIFYSSLAVGWVTTTADVDLGRTFFELLAAYFYFANPKKLIFSGIFLGLALSIKYLALETIGIYTLFIIFSKRENLLADMFKFLFPIIIISVPWLLFAYGNTGNPLYPLLSSVLTNSPHLQYVTRPNIILDFFRLSNQPADGVSPISPIPLAFTPMILVLLIRNQRLRLLGAFVILGYLVWFFIPHTGGSRFFLPYFAILCILAAGSLQVASKKFLIIGLIAVFIVSSGNLLFRTYINSKIIPVLIGKENKNEYLLKNLDFSSTFYDTDGYFAKKIKSSDQIFFVGGQNLFYANFPFVHETWYRGEKYTHVLVQNKPVPDKFKNWINIYGNNKTKVQLLAPPVN